MMFGQYCRIETRAGGVFTSNRQFIRSALAMLRPRSRFNREYRTARHQWLREGLAILANSRTEYRAVMGGQSAREH